MLRVWVSGDEFRNHGAETSNIFIVLDLGVTQEQCSRATTGVAVQQSSRIIC